MLREMYISRNKVELSKEKRKEKAYKGTAHSGAGKAVEGTPGHSTKAAKRTQDKERKCLTG